MAREGEAGPREDGEALRALVQGFVRRFGILAGDRTPCGEPLPVSNAHALMFLLEHASRGTQTQQALGRALGIDKSNVARLCRKMEASGHLVQGRSALDGRARLLSLTEAGVRVARSVEEASRARFETVLAALPPGERAAVLGGLRALNAALERALPPGAAPVRRAASARAPSPTRAAAPAPSPPRARAGRRRRRRAASGSR
jgi:DNA-binding MarR family transcriptional regulator